MNRKISFGICVTVGASLLIGLAAAGAGEETSCDTSLKPGEQCWQGTMHSEATGHHGGNAVCTGEAWDHQVRISVGDDGKVTGAAISNLASAPSCRGPGSWPAAIMSKQARNAAFAVTGLLHRKQLGPDQFELKFAETRIDGGTGGLLNYSLGLSNSPSSPTIVVPLQMNGNAAQGATDVNVPVAGGASAVGRHTVDLKCKAGCCPRWVSKIHSGKPLTYPDLGFDPAPLDEIAPKCGTCSGAWELRDVRLTWNDEAAARTDIDAQGRSIPSWNPTPQQTMLHNCTYTYEAIWTCSTTGEPWTTSKKHLEQKNCVPRE